MAAVERTAVLVIRAWLEEGVEDDGLRARITETRDVASVAHSVSIAGSEPEILAAVECWLRSFRERA